MDNNYGSLLMLELQVLSVFLFCSFDITCGEPDCPQWNIESNLKFKMAVLEKLNCTEAPRLESNVKKVYLHDSSVTHLIPFQFANISKLKYVKIMRNAISTISNMTFFQSYGIIHISIIGNPLKVLPGGLFCTQKNLVLLHLEDNKLIYLHQRHLEGLDSLRWLYLSGNQLINRNEYIHLSWELPKLAYLYLDHNNFLFISISFRKLQKMIRLDMQFNHVEHLRNTTFLGMVSLEYLMLDHNNLSILGANVFMALFSLRVLDLSNNQISCIDPFAFAGLSSLQKLDLHDNKIVSIHGATAKTLYSLNEIDLSNNKLSVISKNSFQDHPSLSIIKLRNNKIHHVQPSSFIHLWKLSVLDLGWNLLSTLTEIHRPFDYSRGIGRTTTCDPGRILNVICLS